MHMLKGFLEINQTIIQELSHRAGITDPFNSEIVWAFEPAWTGDLQQWSQPTSGTRQDPDNVCNRVDRSSA